MGLDTFKPEEGQEENKSEIQEKKELATVNQETKTGLDELKKEVSTLDFSKLTLTSKAKEKNKAEKNINDNRLFFSREHKTYTEKWTALLGTNCPPMAADRMSTGLLSRWYAKIEKKISTYNAAKPENKTASTADIARRLQLSPFDPQARKELGVDADFDMLIENLKQQKDLTTYKETMDPEAFESFLDTPVNYTKEGAKLTDHAEEKLPDPQTISKNFSKKLQQLIDSYEGARQRSVAETVIDATKPFGDGLKQVGAGIADFVKELEASGALTEIKKLWSLLFPDPDDGADFLTRLEKFNVIKESDLSIAQTKAMDTGIKLCEKEFPKTAATDGNPDIAGVTTHMSKNLFAQDNVYDYTPSDDERDSKVKQQGDYPELFTTFKTAYPKQEKYDLIDLAMRNMSGTDQTSYAQFQEYRNKSDALGAQKLFTEKFAAIATELGETAKKEQRKFGSTPNEQFAKSLLATLLKNKSAAQGIAKASVSEIQKELDLVKPLQEITMELSPDNKLQLHNLPAGKKIGYVLGDAPQPTAYPEGGIDIATGSAAKLTLLELDMSGKPVEGAKITNIPVLKPSITKKAGGLSLSGLTGEYISAYGYLENNEQKFVGGTSLAFTTNDIENNLIFPSDKPITNCRIKPKNTPNALRQTIWSAPKEDSKKT